MYALSEGILGCEFDMYSLKFQLLKAIDYLFLIAFDFRELNRLYTELLQNRDSLILGIHPKSNYCRCRRYNYNLD